MKTRKFSKDALKISALGLGTMRLPIVDGDDKCIDEPKAIELIRHAIDNGINYVDTAYMYHGGTSEVVLGKALKDGYREKTYIADKLAMWGCESYDDLTNVFNTQLERLDVDHIDFYMVHCLQRTLWEQKDKLQLFKWCDDLRKSGKVTYLGFSFHDTVDLFKEIIDSYDWDFCQIQYNYLNENIQAGTEGYNYAADKGLPIIIMEPLLGGMLSKSPHDKINKMWEDAGVNQTEGAFKWLLNKPEINIVLSGMSNLKQVNDNINTFSKFGVGSLDEKTSKLIEGTVIEMDKLVKVPCTKCQYCVSECPKNIKIPDIFSYYNTFDANNIIAQILYKNIPENEQANSCIKCNKCKAKCTQEINISAMLAEAHCTLGNELN